MHRTLLRLLAATLLLCGTARLASAGNLASAQLQAAAEYSTAHGGTALLVRQHGKVIFSAGSAGEHKIYSGTKGFWVLAALAATEEGILHLDERVSETIPEWKDDPRRAALTVRELISFTSGLEPKFAWLQNSVSGKPPGYALSLNSQTHTCQ